MCQCLYGRGVFRFCSVEHRYIEYVQKLKLAILVVLHILGVMDYKMGASRKISVSLSVSIPSLTQHNSATAVLMWIGFLVSS